jgi:hypothetical protein
MNHITGIRWESWEIRQTTSIPAESSDDELDIEESSGQGPNLSGSSAEEADQVPDDPAKK